MSSSAVQDSVDHRQAHARAFARALGAEEGVEDTRQHVGLNAAAVVFHLNDQIVAVDAAMAARAHAAHPMRAEEPDVDLTVRSQRVARVHDEIKQRES